MYLYLGDVLNENHALGILPNEQLWPTSCILFTQQIR